VGRRLIFEVCANCGKKILDDEKAMLIDDHNDLIFCDDQCLREHFEEEIEHLESEHIKLRSENDIPLKDFKNYEEFLPMLLNEPDEIWQIDTTETEDGLSFFIGEFFHEKEHIFYVAAAYRTEERPAFVYMHFPTRDRLLVEKYRRGELVYDGEEIDDALDDDELTEGNIAIEIYNEMLENRSDIDIDAEDFGAYADLKLATVDKPEEIWRRIDDSGNTFVIYIAHYQRDSEDVAYVVVAVEDELTDSAVPIFGFPTLDQKLLDRFRTGEMIFKASENF
jgi:hypothetical protein